MSPKLITLEMATGGFAEALETISGLETREYGRRDRLCNTRYPQKLALTSPTGGSRSVGILRSRTKAMEFVFCFCISA
jgi:hypothetical protein